MSFTYTEQENKKINALIIKLLYIYEFAFMAGFAYLNKRK